MLWWLARKQATARSCAEPVCGREGECCGVISSIGCSWLSSPQCHYAIHLFSSLFAREYPHLLTLSSEILKESPHKCNSWSKMQQVAAKWLFWGYLSATFEGSAVRKTHCRSSYKYVSVSCLAAVEGLQPKGNFARKEVGFNLLSIVSNKHLAFYFSIFYLLQGFECWRWFEYCYFTPGFAFVTYAFIVWLGCRWFSIFECFYTMVIWVA